MEVDPSRRAAQSPRGSKLRHHPDPEPGSPGIPKRRASSGSRRRRRPSLWDVREPPYGIPMPPPGASSAMLHAPPRPPTASATAHRGGGEGAGYVPGPNDIVRAPREGESGPLAGINIEALRALINPHAARLGGRGGLVNGAGIGGAVGMGGAGAAYGGVEANAQLTRQARRLYVGNLPQDTTDVQLGDFFNRALVASKGVESPGDPVISVYMNLEKRFAFIETRTVREAAAGLALDGVRFRDMFLRVRKPHDYKPGSEGNVRPPDGFNPSVLGIVSTQVSDGPNKVFIGGIPYNLTEDQIKELLVTYGELGAFNLIKEPTTGMSKGFAFFEFVDPKVVDTACSELHGTQLGDKTLTVRRASSSGGGMSAATYASTGDMMPGGATEGGARPAVSANALLTASTRIVELRNAVQRDELEDDVEYEEIMEEMRTEGRTFGELESVLIPRPADGPEVADGVGRVFLVYAECKGAEKAQVAMSGRRFNEHVVEATFFDEARFAKKDFADR